MSTVINGPTSSPAPQQLVVAQCAMQTDKNLIFGAHNKPIKEEDFKDHHVCVAAHTPVWYDRAGLHSSKINKDVIQVSACGSLLNANGPYQNMNKADEPTISVIRDKSDRLVALQALGVAQAAVSDGASVRASPEAMGRLGVAIGGLVPMTLQTGQMATAQIGDYVYLGSNQSNCTVSGAPKGLELTALITEPPETSGRPRCQRQDTDTGKDDYVKGSAIGRIFQFGPGTDEVQVLLC